MFINEVNDVKIYNLSAGRTIPEWLTHHRKRNQLMKKVDSRRQIELIQDFEMPAVATTIRMSPDQQYILATGTYKPRIKCFEVCNLSIKFERCFDSEATTFEIISDDYKKICDRYVEIHSACGRHYRLRIPSFGRDMKYHKPSCDLFIVGTTEDVYRLNLERGQFLQPFKTNNSCINCCDVNPEHGLLVVGAKEGVVEAWDPRTKGLCSSLDVAIKIPNTKEFPSVSAIKFKNGLQMGVGTESGHVLLYDIRSKEPLVIKNHLNGVPIKQIAFNAAHQTVYSLDEAMLKLWDENSGKQVAYIESATKFNDFCTIPGTGMFFIAQEDVKMLTYYIPGMGPAPRWCSFLDNLAEEIESEVVEHIYDDYQFVTQKELEELGLDNLIGTNLLKGYMHGYFMDVRLYNKAKAVVEPFAFDRFRKEKIRKEIESERKSRLELKANLPKVNQELALKIMGELDGETEKMRPTNNLLLDDRFKAMFENTDFAINKNAEEYKLLAPVLNRLDKTKTKASRTRIEVARVNELHQEESKQPEESDNDEDLFGFAKSDEEKKSDEDSESDLTTDDENMKEYVKELKMAYKNVKKQQDVQDSEKPHCTSLVGKPILEKNDGLPLVSGPGNGDRKKQVKVFSFDSDHVTHLGKSRLNKLSLQERVITTEEMNARIKNLESFPGSRQMSFRLEKPLSKELKKREYQMKKHREERKNVVRSVKSLKLKKPNLK